MSTKSINWKKTGKTLLYILIGILVALFLLASIGTVAQATGLVDNTVDNANEYSRFPLENYQLDFYVDNSWNWLPWNWTDGIGQQVMYGLYAITSFIWTINLYVSNATGYLVQEAYSLDFISDTANAIGRNMQTLAGVNRQGFRNEGFYVGFLLILILTIGSYVAYVGLIKRESTKAINAVMNFIVVFLLSAGAIAYAPDLIGRVNDFSSDISEASLDLGTQIILPNSDTEGSDSVDLIRDSLFSIQVKQPWLLLQYGTNDEEEIGEDRIESLLSTSPNANNGEDREAIVIEEIEERDNANLSITQTTNRLGVVFFISLFNIGISIFVFLLTGIMLFSQVLFIIYAMFLPISFLLSMIPGFSHMSKRALTKLFNTILARAGITLIITVAFSISSMLYSLSVGYPFFLIAFLQIVTFAGIYFKLGDLMGMFALQSNDSQSVSRRVLRKPRMLMMENMHRMQRKLTRSLGRSDKPRKRKNDSDDHKDTNDTQRSPTRKANHQRPTKETPPTKQGEPSTIPKKTKKKATPLTPSHKERPNQNEKDPKKQPKQPSTKENRRKNKLAKKKRTVEERKKQSSHKYNQRRHTRPPIQRKTSSTRMPKQRHTIHQLKQQQKRNQPLLKRDQPTPQKNRQYVSYKTNPNQFSKKKIQPQKRPIKRSGGNAHER
ncbi:CD3337/EF1877 family mobilome membrane protein [Marinilactibacillus psychrotolerans]